MKKKKKKVNFAYLCLISTAHRSCFLYSCLGIEERRRRSSRKYLPFFDRRSPKVRRNSQRRRFAAVRGGEGGRAWKSEHIQRRRAQIQGRRAQIQRRRTRSGLHRSRSDLRWWWPCRQWPWRLRPWQRRSSCGSFGLEGSFDLGGGGL